MGKRKDKKEVQDKKFKVEIAKKYD